MVDLVAHRHSYMQNRYMFHLPKMFKMVSNFGSVRFQICPCHKIANGGQLTEGYRSKVLNFARAKNLDCWPVHLMCISTGTSSPLCPVLLIQPPSSDFILTWDKI